MDNANVDMYLLVCFVIAGSITAVLGLITLFVGLVCMSILLIPLLLVASIIDTFQMISRALDKILWR
jgi:hypothetical protein